MPKKQNPEPRGIPMGCTPHLLFTFGPSECDQSNIPLGPLFVINTPELYLLVRDLLMEQQALNNFNQELQEGRRAIDQCFEAIVTQMDGVKGTEEELDFDIESLYNGPVKVPPHDIKESDGGSDKKEKNGPEVRDS